MKALFVSALVLSHLMASAFAAETLVAPVPSAAKTLGSLELRPSLLNEVGEFHTENNAVAGYQFSKDTSLVFKQEFRTNLYNPLTPAVNGTDVTANDGYLKGVANNLWKDGDWSLGYEGRLYFPTWAVKRDAGMILALRNYAVLGYAASSTLSVGLAEGPEIDVFDRAGNTVGTTSSANPSFTNKTDLFINYMPNAKIRLFVPLKFTAKKNRNYSNTAKFDGAWSYQAIFWPELWYTLDANFKIGAAFYTENLLAPDFSGFTIGDGFRKSATQLIFVANL